MADESGAAITVDRLVVAELPALDPAGTGQATRAHREDRHAFFLLEAGSIQLEIDFQDYRIQAPALVYMHPD